MYFKLILILLVLSAAQDTCYSDSDCLELNTCENNKCQHKSLFPLATTEYIGLVVMIIVSSLANAGGVGGSSMTISLMLLMHKFNPHACVALTQVFIFAGTCTATLLKIKDRHPTRDRPLIYYDVLMVIVSPILIGVSIGVMLNPAFPGWLILTLLTLIVIVLVWDVLKRSFFLYKKEKSLKTGESEPNHSKSQVSGKTTSVLPITERLTVKGDKEMNNEELEENKEDVESGEKNIRINSQEKIEDNGDEKVEISLVSDRNEESPNLSINNTNIPPGLLRRLTTIYQEEKKIIAWIPLFYFLSLAGVSILYSLLKGSSSSKSIAGIKPCSDVFFGMAIAYYGFMLTMSLLASIYLVRKTFVLEQTNYVFDEGDIRWSYKKCSIVSSASIVAGIVVGLLGMGGGNLIGPMLLAMGVRPEISTISSSFTIFISSGTAAAMYFITGLIDFQYAGWFFLLSVIGSLIGILILRKIAIKKQRVSLLIFCLFFILFASLIIIPTTGILGAIKQSNEGTFQLGFKSIC